ncbi:hypothetical protein BC937DRAFT_94164 [Endogone sp. FLAS-F59071]|nr:hypothetical protein BC937DRAFT_94164 [Endogone sp. FLAS-F59071]|eukprot:RUS20870.1 hypothetical protein BC937DRAFT_94164 [Endogone sp. FLAS-F59071]
MYYIESERNEIVSAPKKTKITLVLFLVLSVIPLFRKEKPNGTQGKNCKKLSRPTHSKMANSLFHVHELLNRGTAKINRRASAWSLCIGCAPRF